jgi:hypothetical protein
MPTQPPFVNQVTGGLIQPQPINSGFASLYNLVNNVSGLGLDFANIGSAGVNVSLFTTGLTASTAIPGGFSFTGYGVFNGLGVVGASAAALSGSYTAGSVLFGRASGAAALALGGTTSVFMIYNAGGLKDIEINGQVSAGYQGSAGVGTLLPVYNALGTDLGYGRVILLPNTPNTSFPGFTTTTLTGAAVFSTANFLSFGSTSSAYAATSNPWYNIGYVNSQTASTILTSYSGGNPTGGTINALYDYVLIGT